jgi:diguanylate cyclase (GGDEF)-like protein
MDDESATQGQSTPPEQSDQEPEGASEATVEASAVTTGHRSGVRIALWTLAALLCVLTGAAGSLLVAHSLANRQTNDARSAFAASSAQVASNLNNAVRHQEDLTVAASSFAAAGKKVTVAEFDAWSRWARAFPRYPALQRLGLIKVAGHSQRCLNAAEVVRGNGLAAPAGVDYCAREKRLLASRGSGVSIVRTPAGHPGILEVQTPIYRGLAPGSVKARNAAFVGWLREAIRPDVMARQALAGHSGYAVGLRYGRGPAATAFAGGETAAANVQSASTRLINGWTLESVGPPATASLLGEGRIWILAAGLLIGAMLGLLALALAVRRAPPEQPAPALDVVPPPSPEPPAPVQEVLSDPLTGLPARALTLDRAERMIARAGRQSGMLAGVLLIDIDWFKDVNEKLGRQAGDQLLQIVAERLEGAMRAEDTVGRMEGDRFAVLVECSSRSARLDSLAQRVLETLHLPLELDGFGPSFFMTASIGAAFGRYESPADLLRDGGLALESAKAAGRDRYMLFNASTSNVIEGRGVLETELSAALAGQQLFLLYQPIYDLGARRVVGLEAQPHWQHPERGTLPAAEFLPLAEECGLIVPIDRWALEQACSRAAAWEVEGHSVGVSVKIAADQLHREGLITDIRRALQQSGVQPALLTLQVPETAVMHDVAAAAERLGEIKRLGVRLAIEDFGGSGYAYHSDLRLLPLDCLRVDRSALAASDDSDYREWLFEAILMVGRELSLTVIAKGIESREQLSAIQARGCTTAQGPSLGAPVPAEAVVSVCEAGLPVAAPPGVAPAIEPAPAAVLPAWDAVQPS